ncbi:hypothetical protein [Cryptosporangium sp. NPDC048952]|uniref:hypothetical protein n=1 Tax=Cryptosporangium sp. NPDC048952 TaxID=3363961 RepID=UPI0037109CC2
MNASTATQAYDHEVADEAGNFVVEGLDPEDLAVLAAHGIDAAALVQAHLHERAEQIRAEERHAYRKRLIREVGSSDRFGRATTEEIVDGIHADRREAGWE